MKLLGDNSALELKGWFTLYGFLLVVYLLCSFFLFIYGYRKIKYDNYIMAVLAFVVGVAQLKIASICFSKNLSIYRRLKKLPRDVRSPKKID
jgi:hypothetical protein